MLQTIKGEEAGQLHREVSEKTNTACMWAATGVFVPMRSFYRCSTLCAGCAYQVTLHQQISALASECVSKRCDCLSWQHGRQHAAALHLCPRSLYVFLGNMYLLDDHPSEKTIFQSMLEVYFATEVGILVTRAGCLPSWAEAGSGLPAGYRLDPRAQGPRHSIEGCISLLRDASVGRLQNVWIYLT